MLWTIDLVTQEVVDKFTVSMGDKKVVAPLHIGFAYTQPLAVVGNILDKKNGYLTLLSTATRRPIDIIELSCQGARDAMFTKDDSKIFSTCQQGTRGVSIVDVKQRKEIKMVPIKSGRAGGMTPDGKYFLAAGKGVVVVFDTKTGNGGQNNQGAWRRRKFLPVLPIVQSVTQVFGKPMRLPFLI